MGDAAVALFTTQELHNNDPDAKLKIKAYLADAFEETPHTVSTAGTSEHPDPPTEKIFDSITDTVCGDKQKTYSDLLGWWADYHRCNSLPEAADANLLVTNASNLAGRGFIGGNMSVAAGAQIAKLSCCSTVETADSEARYDAMQTSIHEIGHNLGLGHGDGYHNVTLDDYFQSFMMHDYSDAWEGGDNNCGRYLENTDNLDQHNDFSWSECAESNMSL